MILSHCNWANNIAKETFEFGGSRELFKNFKKYHISFINLCLNNLIDKDVENLDYKSILILLTIGNVKHLKNRTNSRLLYSIGLKGIKVLSEFIEELENQTEKDVEIMRYYMSLTKVILNKKSENEVKNELENYNIDLDSMIEKYEEFMQSLQIEDNTVH